MPRLSAEQVMGLAPDPASAAAGRELSGESKWIGAGASGDSVWGEAKGSGKLPYQTAVDLSGIAYKCSCPSRKIPCKHALGLLLRHSQNQISEGEPPTWVEEWLSKRTEKAVKKAEAPTPPNSEGTAVRAEKRWKNILGGLDECEAFLNDAVAQGLLATNSTRTWDQMAARMVDAQAPGIAARLKQIGGQIGVGPKWIDQVVPRLGGLSLLIQAARSIERLDAGLQADVRSALGISMRKEDISGEQVIDIWDVLGQSQRIEDRLTVFQTWLRGRATRRWALHLAFSAPGPVSESTLVPGTALAGSIRFYESSYPFRAHLEEVEYAPFFPLTGEGCDYALDTASEGWAKSPWIEEFPVQLSRATFGADGGEWVVIDSEGNGLPVVDADFSSIFALSGNHPCEVCGEWSGRKLRVVSAWGAWGFVRV